MMNQYLKAFLVVIVAGAILATLLYIFHIAHQEFRETKKEYIRGEKAKAIGGMIPSVGGLVNRP
jgi:hypothetical protein